MEDSEIVDLYFAREESAILQTAQKYGSGLRKIANAILGSMELAEECENDTYLRAWNLIPPNEPRTYLFPFLGKITRHLAIDECRKHAAQKRKAILCELTKEMEECISGGSSVEGTIQAGALSQAISAFLGKCPEEQRNVFMRRYWFFDSIPEICQRYGYSQSKVKTMLFRMREELRKHLEKEGYVI